MNTDGPVQEWPPLAPPDTFGGFLDRVELALLQQVRSKSDELFQESLRFALLQEWIQASRGTGRAAPRRGGPAAPRRPHPRWRWSRAPTTSARRT